MKFLTQFSLQRFFAFALFFCAQFLVAQLHTAPSCTNPTASGTLVWETSPTNSSEFDWTPDGAFTNTFNNISGSGVNTTITFSGDISTLDGWNGFGGDTPEVATNNGQEALQFFTNGFNSTGITITIAFSQPVNATGFDLAHINGSGPNGDSFTITASEVGGGTIFPTFTASGTPSYTTNTSGFVNSNNNSVAGDNDELGINFSSTAGINSITLVWDECTTCSPGSGHGSAIQDISFCVATTVDPCDAVASGNLDTDGDGISDICDLDDDNDGILDTVENNECPDGSSAAKAFGSLGEARNVSAAGIYFFNISGQAFSTYVDASGFVQVAIDFGNGSGNLPQGTSLTNSTRGILTPAVLATLTATTQIRISHSGGNFDVTTTNATLLARVVSNSTLHRGVADNGINNSWTGTNSAAITINATNTTALGNSLNENIVHPSGVNGFHWIPSRGFQRIFFNSGQIGATESFTLWVQAAATTCDTDNDGIINSLDTDADNDGCPDAVEAAGSFLPTQLTALTGGSNGAGSSLLNFGTTVNTTQGSANYGVPIQDANGLAIAANLPQVMAPAVLNNTINACQADLSLTKTVDKAIVKVGDTIIYTLTLKNDGSGDATGVQVTDVLPTGLSFLSATPSVNYTNGTGIWNVGNLAAGANVSLQINATVSGVGAIVNTAQVTQSTQTDPDSTPNNGN